MRLSVPKKYRREFRLPSPLFKTTERYHVIEIDTPIGFEITRDFIGIGPRNFVKMFKEIKVTGGRKVRKGETILFEPARTKRKTIRIAPSELEIIEKAAKASGKSVSQYMVTAALGQAILQIYSATEEAQRNPR